MKGSTLFKGEIITKVKLYWRNLKFLFSRTAGPISSKLGTNYSWLKGIQVYSNEGPHLFPRGDNYEKSKMHWQNWKKKFLQTRWANFNQTWHKSLLAEGDSNLFKWRAPPFTLRNSENTLIKLKNLLLQSCSQFQRNLAKIILRWRGFLFQMKGHALIQGKIITK